MTDTNTAQMVADLTSTNSAVQGNGWVSPELGGAGGSLSLLGSTFDPLSGLASAGLAWFTPFVSFLSDGLSQLQGGNAASVASGSQDFGNAGQDITSLAGSYGNSVNAQTSSWTGNAASDYRNAGTQHANGVAGLGAASTTVGSSIIGAGQVVAQAIAEITELIGEAVAEIVPILTTAVSQAQETMGQSVVAAIPPCVGIAVKTALQIASKLAALLASGQNLLKLVQGALGVVDLIQQALSSISQQSTQGGTDPTSSTANPSAPADSGSTGPTAPTSTDSGATTPSDSGGSGGPADAGGSPDFGGSTVPAGMADVGSPADPGGSDPGAFSGANPLGDAAQSAAVVQPFNNTMPAASAIPASGGQVPTAGAFPMSAAGIGLAAGARSGADTVRQNRTVSPPPASTDERATSGGVPLGGMGARSTGEKDKEHKRKYNMVEQHDEVIMVAPPVIGGER